MTRDTWEGDQMQPMSYNAWLYTYANPVNLIDPSGRVPCELLPPGEDRIGCELQHGILFSVISGAWSPENFAAATRAVWLVANRLADELGSGSETYWDIFKAVYGISEGDPMEFRWNPQVVDANGHRIANGCYYCRPTYCYENIEGEDDTSKEFWTYDPNRMIRGQGGSLNACKCRPTGGVTLSARLIEFASIWENYSGAGGESVQFLRKVNNVIHELGHAFNDRIGGVAASQVSSYSRVINGGLWPLMSRPRGFYLDVNNSGDMTSGDMTWVQTIETTGSEIFADMFIGWVYNKWAKDDYGDERALFMDERMQGWIEDAMGRP